MKRLYLSVAFALCLAVIGCNKQHFNDEAQASPTGLSVEAAKAIFEEAYLKTIQGKAGIMARSVSAEQSTPQSIVPDDYTPQWEKASMSGNYNESYVEVPILTDAKYYAYIGTTSEIKLLSQKLIVKKNSDKETVVLLTLIPTSQTLSSVEIKKFNAGASKGNFDGVALYNYIDGQLYGMEEYANGNMVNSMYADNGNFDVDAGKQIMEDINIDVTPVAPANLWIETYPNRPPLEDPFKCYKCGKNRLTCDCGKLPPTPGEDSYCKKCGGYLSNGKCHNAACNIGEIDPVNPSCPRCGATMNKENMGCLVCGYGR